MAYCSRCGLKAEEGASFCVGCGSPVQSRTESGQPTIYYGAPGAQISQGTSINTYFENAPATTKPGEGNNFWWGFLAFMLGPFGFILYFTSRQLYPKRAKVILICSIVGTIAAYALSEPMGLNAGLYFASVLRWMFALIKFGL